jgi:hypothetical protein
MMLKTPHSDLSPELVEKEHKAGPCGLWTGRELRLSGLGADQLSKYVTQVVLSLSLAPEFP